MNNIPYSDELSILVNHFFLYRNKCSRSFKKVVDKFFFRNCFKNNFAICAHICCDDDNINNEDGGHFVECPSNNLESPVQRDEITPKRNQAEEKVNNRRDGVSLKKNVSTSSCLTQVQHDDSGIIDMSERTENRDHVMRSTSVVNADDSIQLCSATDTTPEKFKQFLHDRCEETDRVGISFNQEEQDGYFPEDRDDRSDIAILNEPSLAIALNQMVWEKMTLLL